LHGKLPRQKYLKNDDPPPAPLPAEDRRNIQEKNIDALKKQLPNGATEQMWKWARNAQKNGGRITEQDKVEIRGAFSMELDKLPVPKDRDEARQIATKRMVDEAKEMNADAVIGVKYGSSQVMSGAAEVIAYGTAVKYKQD